MNAKIEKLLKAETAARNAADRLYRAETKWQKAYEAARKTPEWKAHCAKTGSVTSYNFGDVTC